VDHLVTLRPAPGAAIYYTLDGSQPTPDSPLFDPYHLIPVTAGHDGVKGLTQTHTIRAIALAPGLEQSEPVDFHFTVTRRDKDSYLSKEISPGVWQIVDYDSTKLYLLKGTKSALLIDTGLGSGGLRKAVQSLVGSLPLVVVISHGHPDHIACTREFQDDTPIYMHPADLPLVERFNQSMNYGIDPAKLIALHEGHVFDLGGKKLKVYEVPGHSPGSLVLFDEDRGQLFAGDALGSNRPAIVDAVWMQMPGHPPLDSYAVSVQVFRDKLRGWIKQTYTGHNDEALRGEAYLDHLQKAIQNVVERGVEALQPSVRPVGVWQTVSGDRFSDPNWMAINVDRERCLSASPDEITTLSNIKVRGGKLEPQFTAGVEAYELIAAPRTLQIEISAFTVSRRVRALEINGQASQPGSPVTLRASKDGDKVEVRVTAPNGKTSRTYTLTLRTNPA
jgi:glyoxylase-like metal-dependent hydrolase (beta-lactamase superfamily II)